MMGLDSCASWRTVMLPTALPSDPSTWSRSLTNAEHPRLVRNPITVISAVRSPLQLSREVLARLVTTLALAPEVISFSIVAGVDPMVSLVASIVLAVTMSILGGRTGVITAAAGSVALVIAPPFHDHGVQYVLPTVVLAGVIQIVFGLAGLARLRRIREWWLFEAGTLGGHEFQ